MKDSFGELFQTAFNKYLEKNPRLSLRSFAKSLGLAPSTVHQYLNGTYPPTARNLRHIGQMLGWDKELIEDLLSGIRASKHPDAVRIYCEDLSPLFVELLILFQRWVNQGNTEVILSRFVSDFALSASRSEEMDEVFQFLKSHGVLRGSGGKYSLINTFKLITKKTPTGPILEFQKKSLRRYEKALTQVDKEKRLSLIADLCIDEKDYSKVSDDMNKFVKKLRTKYGNKASSQKYQIICGLIPLD